MKKTLFAVLLAAALLAALPSTAMAWGKGAPIVNNASIALDYAGHRYVHIVWDTTGGKPTEAKAKFYWYQAGTPMYSDTVLAKVGHKDLIAGYVDIYPPASLDASFYIDHSEHWLTNRAGSAYTFAFWQFN